MYLDDTLKAAIVLPLLFVVTVCAITDISSHRIPNIVLGPALSLAFLINVLLAGFGGFVECALGLLFGLAVMFPLYFAGGTSAGDVKLLGVVGAFLGTSGAIVAGLATFVIGGILGILFIVWRLVQASFSAHGAKLVRSAGATGPSLDDSDDRDTSRNAEFPYAPAIACGTYFSLWHLGYFSQVLG